MSEVINVQDDPQKRQVQFAESELRKKIQLIPNESNAVVNQESKTAKLFKKRRLSVYHSHRPKQQQSNVFIPISEDSSIAINSSLENSSSSASQATTSKFNTTTNFISIPVKKANSGNEIVITESSTNNNNIPFLTPPLPKSKDSHANRAIDNVSKETEEQCSTSVSTKKIKLDDDKKRKTKKAENDNKNFIYRLINNIGYVTLKNCDDESIWYKCFIAGCPFKFLSEIQMEYHLNHYHSDIKWNGYCTVCEQTIICNNSNKIESEFMHMITVHIDVIKTKSKKRDLTEGNIETRLAKRRHSAMPRKLTENINNHDAETFFSNVDQINLRPWLKNFHFKYNAAAAMMQQQNALVALFKCMYKSCCFFTSDPELFKRHLKLHQPNFEVLMCSYCPFSTANTENFFHHIQLQHCNDAYQCIYCFYRSTNERNVHTHILNYHSDKAIVMIEANPCHELSKVEDNDKQITRNIENLKRFVAQFECLACSRTFHFHDEFERHILQNHKNLTETKSCKDCHKIIKLAETINHSLICQNRGKFQCLHCHFGSNTYKDIYLHLADCHQSRIPLFCDRSTCAPDKNSANFKSIDIKIVDYKLNDCIMIKKGVNNEQIRNERCVNFLSYKSHNGNEYEDFFQFPH